MCAGLTETAHDANDTFTSFVLRIIRGAGHLGVHRFIFMLLLCIVLQFLNVVVFCNQCSMKIIHHGTLCHFILNLSYIHENQV